MFRIIRGYGGNMRTDEYRKKPKTNFMLSAGRTKVNQMSNEKMGGKYETVIGHLV
jgi:hypothetical protein